MLFTRWESPAKAGFRKLNRLDYACPAPWRDCQGFVGNGDQLSLRNHALA